MQSNDLMLELLKMAVSLSTLALSSHVAIKNAIRVSESTGVSRSSIGFTLIAVSTSLPELAVAISSAISGTAAVSVGNVLGSNVANVFLIAGLGLFFASFTSKVEIYKFKPEEFDFLYFGIFIASAVPLILVSLLPASRFVGGLLVALYAYYTFKIVFRKGIENPTTELQVKFVKHSRVAPFVVFTLLGVAGVVLSSHFLVESTVNVALSLSVPESLISATVVAVGTSLPELALDLQAFLKGEPGLAFGDMIGSNFTNTTLILGATLLLSPININIKAFYDLATFSILANIVLWYLMSRGKFGRMEGIYLLSSYILFLASIMGLLAFG